MRRRIAISTKPAAALTAQEAALLAAVLPDPRDWSPVRPTQYIAERAANIRDDMPAMAVPSAMAAVDQSKQRKIRIEARGRRGRTSCRSRPN